VAYKLSQAGVKVVGIPKTIDKDLSGTDYTLGFETAMNVITKRSTDCEQRQAPIAGSSCRDHGKTCRMARAGRGESSGAYIILIPSTILRWTG